MSEAPGPTELATTQLLPYLAAGGNEEAWRAFVVRYRPRILRWCRRLQADDAEEVASRVLHKLVVGLARGVYRRHDPGTFRGWLRRVVGNEVVDFARRQRAGQPAGDVLHCWPDPVSIDELAGELDEEFRTWAYTYDNQNHMTSATETVVRHDDDGVRLQVRCLRQPDRGRRHDLERHDADGHGNQVRDRPVEPGEIGSDRLVGHGRDRRPQGKRRIFDKPLHLGQPGKPGVRPL